jgi:hypothetical protein
MIKVTLTVAVLCAIIGAVIMGLTDLFWTPIFFFALAISIALFNASIRVGLIGLGVSAALYVVVYFVEPRWLQVLLTGI